LGLGVHWGSSGSMTSHSSSGSKGLAMIVTSRRKFPRERRCDRRAKLPLKKRYC
jgi:hypothetical protein